MKTLLHSTGYKTKAAALLIVTATFIDSAEVRAQTLLTATGLSGAVAGASTNVAATNSDPLYNNTGPTTNGIRAVTFGNGFSMTATGPSFGNFDNSFIIGGTIAGSSISAGTTMPVSYDFSLAKNNSTAIPGNVTWSLTLSDSVNGGSQQIATGTLTGLSATFSGNGNDYTFTTGVSSGTTFLATLEVTYAGNNPLSPPVVTGTMLNTGFDQQGITLNASAIPEPSTYAAIAGLGMLGFAVWRRRKAT